MPKQYLTVDQVGQLVQLHPEVVRRAIRRGELQASRLCGRLRVSQQDFLAWIEATAIQPEVYS